MKDLRDASPCERGPLSAVHLPRHKWPGGRLSETCLNAGDATGRAMRWKGASGCTRDRVPSSPSVAYVAASTVRWSTPVKVVVQRAKAAVSLPTVKPHPSRPAPSPTALHLSVSERRRTT